MEMVNEMHEVRKIFAFQWTRYVGNANLEVKRRARTIEGE
jgi:hypothetical protein